MPTHSLTGAQNDPKSVLGKLLPSRFQMGGDVEMGKVNDVLKAASTILASSIASASFSQANKTEWRLKAPKGQRHFWKGKGRKSQIH
jgi:hypothetical protein